MTAHFNLQLLYAELGNEAKSAEHAKKHAKYKPDDNAQGRAVSGTRKVSGSQPCRRSRRPGTRCSGREHRVVDLITVPTLRVERRRERPRPATSNGRRASELTFPRRAWERV